MTLQSSGAISLSDIAAEFGGSTPHSLSEYYGVDTGVPSSGTISFSDFYGTSNVTYIMLHPDAAYWDGPYTGGSGGSSSGLYDLPGYTDVRLAYSYTGTSAAEVFVTYDIGFVSGSTYLTGYMRGYANSGSPSYTFGQFRGWTSGYLSGSYSNYVSEIGSGTSSFSGYNSFFSSSSYPYLSCITGVHFNSGTSSTSGVATFYDYELYY